MELYINGSRWQFYPSFCESLNIHRNLVMNNLVYFMNKRQGEREREREGGREREKDREREKRKERRGEKKGRDAAMYLFLYYG